MMPSHFCVGFKSIFQNKAVTKKCVWMQARFSSKWCSSVKSGNLKQVYTCNYKATADTDRHTKITHEHLLNRTDNPVCEQRDAYLCLIFWIFTKLMITIWCFVWGHAFLLKICFLMWEKIYSCGLELIQIIERMTKKLSNTHCSRKFNNFVYFRISCH